MNLADKVVVITGAGSGIGRATALAVSARGGRVVACDVDQPRLDALARSIGERALLVRNVDVADRAQMVAFADAVHALVPAVDVVINNAGVVVGAEFLDTTLDDWDWVLGVNLRGVIHGCKLFLPNMVERGAGGHVVNVSSIFGIYPAPHVTSYVASKFAVLGFSQSLRVELAPLRIGVTAICPGIINTAIVERGRLRGGFETRRAKIAAMFQARGAPPELVASAILDAIRTNPAVRTVGRDAAVVHALARLSPRIVSRLGATLGRRFGAGR